MFRESVEEVCFIKSDKNKGYIHEVLCTFMIYIFQFLLEWGMFQNTSCRQNQTFYIQLPFSDNRVIYELMWGKNGTARQATDGSWMRRMRSACCMAMTTDTNLEYVIFIALPPRQWLNEFTLVFRYKYIACLLLRWQHASNHTHWQDTSGFTACKYVIDRDKSLS